MSEELHSAIPRRILAILIQRVLGWSYNLKEDAENIWLESQSCFTSDDDPGWVRVIGAKQEVLKLIKSNEVR